MDLHEITKPGLGARDPAAEISQPSRRRRIHLLLSILVSVLTVAVLLWFVDFDKVVAVLKDVKPIPLVAAISVGVFAQLVAGWRLQAIFRFLHVEVPMSAAQKIHFGSLWCNQVLPTGLGGDVVRVVGLQRYGGWSAAVRGVLLDRVYGLSFLLLVCAVLAPVTYVLLGYGEVAIMLALIGVGGLVVLAFLVLFLGHLTRLLSALGIVKLAIDDFRRLVLSRPSGSLLAALVLFPGLSILSYALVGRALDVHVSALVYAALVPLIFVIMQFPISYGGWGPREAATVALFAPVGVPSAQSFSMAVLFGLVLTVTALPGVAFLTGRHVLGSNYRYSHEGGRN